MNMPARVLTSQEDSFCTQSNKPLAELIPITKNTPDKMIRKTYPNIKSFNQIPAWFQLLVSEHIKSFKSIEARDYQIKTVTKALYYFHLGVPSVMIESPTGSGKTIIGLLIATFMQQLEGSSVAWVAMRRNLLSQVTRESIKYEFNLRFDAVSGFQKKADRKDLFILDEAHHEACDTLTRLWGVIKPTFTLGLSATPYRGDSLQLVFQKSVTEAGIFQLIRDGYLATVEHYTLAHYSPTSVSKLFIKHIDHFGKSVMFFRTIAECEKAESLLLSAGVTCCVVTGKSNKEQQIRDFKRGEYQVLINMIILTEGFDCPEIETVFVRPSNKGTTAQMVGRVLRKKEGVQKKVVQCAATKNPFVKFGPIKTKFMVNKKTLEFEEIKENKLIEETIIAMRRAILGAEIDVCSINALSAMAPKKRRRFLLGGMPDGL